MAETFSTDEFVEVELKMLPVPPGTKSTRYASRHPAPDDPSTSPTPPPETLPPDQPPENVGDSDL